jgi:predicted transcriptional regulator YdeE
MDYFAGTLLPIDYETPEGFESVDFPAGEYLAVTHLGPISTIAASYQRAYMESLGASGREMRPAPHLEIYNPDLNPMADDYEMVIAIPVI